MNKFFRIGS